MRRKQVHLAERENLPTDPDFSTFIENYQTYCDISRSARMHTRPFSIYLGRQLSNIDRVFKIEDMADFFALISERSGKVIPASRENTALPETRDASVSRDNIDQLREITAKDYRFLAGAYDFDQAVEKLTLR